MSFIVLRCRQCGDRGKRERAFIQFVSPRCVLIEQEHCTDCWSGESDVERWFDMQDRQIATVMRAKRRPRE